jgi:hypothetical protein
MTEKSGIFKIWLVGAANPTSFQYNCYGEGAMYAIGMKLKTMFNTICQHSKSPFAAADYSWEKGNVAPTDVVVYCCGTKEKGSIIKSKSGVPIHESASGGTFAYTGGMISEIYLRTIDGAANFSSVAANIIFHEIMHNKLDAPAKKSVFDIHTLGGGGLASPTVSAGSALTAKNIELMAGALSKVVPQYTAEMQKPLTGIE